MSLAQPKAIKSLRVTTTYTAPVHIDRSFLSLIIASPNQAGVPELQYGVWFAETRMKNIVDDMISSQYLSDHSRSTNVLYMSYVRGISTNKETLRLLESPNEGEDNEKQPEISHLNRDILQASQASFDVLTIQKAEFQMNNRTESADFHDPRFRCMDEQLLQKL